MPDTPLAAVVVPRLRGRLGLDYRFLARCPSTQRVLALDAREGAVAVTDEQTEVRGRLGRTWLAPAGSSVLCSVVLRPAVESDRLPELTVVAGAACAAAIRAVTGLEPTVKLPNDVLVGGRKVAGILAEASDGRVVLGIGINVHQTRDELPAETDPPATALDLEAGVPVDRAELVVALLAELEERYDGWVASANEQRAVDDQADA